jgi:hypothetical protein
MEDGLEREKADERVVKSQPNELIQKHRLTAI